MSLSELRDEYALRRMLELQLLALRRLSPLKVMSVCTTSSTRVRSHAWAGSAERLNLAYHKFQLAHRLARV
jgi:hypothetical protein